MFPVNNVSWSLWVTGMIYGTELSYGAHKCPMLSFWLWMGLPHICPVVKIIKHEECKQQENSIMSQKRSDIAHRVTFSKLLDFWHYNLDLKQILVKFNSPRQLGYQVDKLQKVKAQQQSILIFWPCKNHTPTLTYYKYCSKTTFWDLWPSRLPSK